MFVATECPRPPSSLGRSIIVTVPALLPGSSRSARPEGRTKREEGSSGQWECLRRYLARQAKPVRFRVVEMIHAYELATGTCIGCD